MDENQFQIFYERKLLTEASDLQQVISQRKKYRLAQRIYKTVFILLIIATFMSITGKFLFLPEWLMPKWAWAVFFLSWLGLWLYGTFKNHSEILKEGIFAPLLREYGDLAMGSGTLKECAIPFVELLPVHQEHKITEHITGEFLDKEMTLVHLDCTEEISSTDADGNDEESTRHVWQGMVAALPCQVEIKGTYIVKSKAAWAGTFDGAGAEIINLESPTFSKAFKYYGTDQIEGRVLFDPEAISRWLELTGEIAEKRAFKIVWREGMVYFAMTGGEYLLDYALEGEDVKAMSRNMAKEVAWIFGLLRFAVLDVFQKKQFV